MIAVFTIASVFGIIIDCLMVDSKLKKVWIAFLVLLFCFIAANRALEIPDTEAYLLFIQNVKTDVEKYGLFSLVGTFEAGFEFFIRCMVWCGFDYKIIFFVFALIVSYLGLLVFKDKRLPIVSWLVFISFYGIYFSFVILRAGISIMCFCYFIKFNATKKVRSILILILSFFFHKSVLFAFTIYIICKFAKQKTLSSNLIVLCIFFVIYVSSLGSAIVLQVANYLNGFLKFSLWERFTYYINNFEVAMFHVSFRLVLNIVIYCAARYLNKEEPNENKVLMDKIIFAGLLINLFLGSSTVVGRMVDFLLVFNIKNILEIIKRFPQIQFFGKYKVSFTKQKSYGAIIITNQHIFAFIFAGLFILVNLLFIVRIIF